jgi:hypothetical protein
MGKVSGSKLYQSTWLPSVYVRERHDIVQQVRATFFSPPLFNMHGQFFNDSPLNDFRVIRLLKNLMKLNLLLDSRTRKRCMVPINGKL